MENPTPVNTLLRAFLISGIVIATEVALARAQDDQVPIQLGVALEGGAAFLDSIHRGLDFVSHEVIVKFKDGTSRADQQRALMVLRSRPEVDDLRWRGLVAIATDLSQPDATVLASQLRRQPEVEYAEPNYLFHTTFTPNDPSYATRQWNLPAIDMSRAWDIYGADSQAARSAVTVAVIDTGLTTITQNLVLRTWSGSGFTNAVVPFAISPDLSSTRLVPGFDFVLTNNAMVFDVGGHGTHVASTIGEETNNAASLAGIAYDAKIMPLKTLACYWDRQFLRSALGFPGYEPVSTSCFGSVANIAAAIRFAADNGAKVINMSLGGTNPTTTYLDAINYAVGRGVFMVMSAGNDYESGNPTHYSAKWAEMTDGAMAVASIGRSLGHAYYSSSGSYVEIAAPGGDTRADGSSGGIWQVTVGAEGSSPFLIFPRFDGYEERSFQGTSMAAPHIAGVAALIYTRMGTVATPALVEYLIESTARACTSTSCNASAVGTRARNDFFGAGLVQPRTALFGVGLRK